MHTRKCLAAIALGMCRIREDLSLAVRSSYHMYHEKQGVLEHHRTVVGKEHCAFGCCLDVAEDLTVVRVDNVGKRFT